MNDICNADVWCPIAWSSMALGLLIATVAILILRKMSDSPTWGIALGLWMVWGIFGGVWWLMRLFPNGGYR